MTTATPTYQISANGKDITDTLQGLLIDFTVTDNRGFESDTLDINLDDITAAILWPQRGASIKLLFGYVGQPLHDCGAFVVDELSHSGPPDKLSIRCKAADLLAAFKGAKTRSFHATTLGKILETIAADNKLQLAASSSMMAKPIAHIDQTNESDLHFITRLGERYGAVAKIADGRLLFTEAGKATSASGKPLPVAAIDRSQIDTHDYTQAGRGEYTGVEAVWHDVRKAKKRKATASAAKKPKKKKKTTRKALPPKMVVSNEEETAGSSDNVKRLKQTFPDEATAKAAAAAEWQRLQRDKETLELDIKHGVPGLKAETKVIVTGFPPTRTTIMGEWVATEVSHTLSASSGLSSRVKLERLDDYTSDDNANDNANDTTS